jgi:hypothetical protein
MRFLYSCLVFVFLFFSFAYLYILYETTGDRRKFTDHAAVISGDVWAFNEVNARVYLSLALQRDHYKSLAVHDPQEAGFPLRWRTPTSAGSTDFWKSSVLSP